MSLLFLINFLSSFILIGLIWTIQIVHYPLFAKIGPMNFPEYHSKHASYITYLVLPLMLTELVSSILRVQEEKSLITSLELISVVIAWTSTIFIQVPLHNQLSVKFDIGLIEQLVLTNWIRTIAWTLKGGLGCIYFRKLLESKII